MMATRKKPRQKPQKTSVGDLVGELSRRAPLDFAEDWDNVGLLAGDAADPVTGVVVAVNLGPEALEAAGRAGANVVVCHHPPIFKPVSRLTRAATPYLYEAVRRGMSVVALHTNFDLASEQLSRNLASKLGLEFSGFLAQRGGEQPPRSLRRGKFVTYVPAKDLERVRDAVCAAGAGRIGDYTDCSFSSEGVGTFRGGEGTKPAIGKAGRLETAQERRLEVVFPWAHLDRLISAASAAHPYEEMAFDVLELAQSERRIGYGFVAEAEEHLVFHKLLDNVKETFRLRSTVVAGPGLIESKMRVRRVAWSPGSGSAFVGAASAKGADVYVCGEVGYHQMLDARQRGLTLIVLGHSYSERFFIETVSDWCEALTPAGKVFETVHDSL